MIDIVIFSDDNGIKEIIINNLSNDFNLKINQFSKAKKVHKYLQTNNPQLIIADVTYTDNSAFIEFLENNTSNFPLILIMDDAENIPLEKIRKVKPYIFLSKPTHSYTILSACYAILDNNFIKKRGKKNIIVKSKGKFINLQLDSIQYIVSQGNNCKIYLKSKSYEVRYPLSKFQSDLNHPYIIRSHRQYLVNIKKVSKLDVKNNKIYIDEVELPVGRLYKKLLKTSIKSHIT